MRLTNKQITTLAVMAVVVLGALVVANAGGPFQPCVWPNRCIY